LSHVSARPRRTASTAVALARLGAGASLLGAAPASAADQVANGTFHTGIEGWTISPTIRRNAPLSWVSSFVADLDRGNDAVRRLENWRRRRT
jgi:hypothetical protein